MLGRVRDACRADNAVDVAAALELMDAAIIAHYYEQNRPRDERLLSGDHGYALAMSLVAAQGRPELVGALASATTDVARGHAEATVETNDEVLALRSALFPAAVALGDTLEGRPADAGAVSAARAIGVAREAMLAGVDGAAKRLEEAGIRLETSSPRSRIFGQEGAYIAQALLEMARTSKV